MKSDEGPFRPEIIFPLPLSGGNFLAIPPVRTGAGGSRGVLAGVVSGESVSGGCLRAGGWRESGLRRPVWTCCAFDGSGGACPAWPANVRRPEGPVGTEGPLGVRPLVSAPLCPPSRGRWGRPRSAVSPRPGTESFWGGYRVCLDGPEVGGVGRDLLPGEVARPLGFPAVVPAGPGWTARVLRRLAGVGGGELQKITKASLALCSGVG